MVKYKYYWIQIIAVIILFALLAGNAFAGGIWELENSWYHIVGTWIVTPNTYQYLDENRIDGDFRKTEYVGSGETSELDAYISYNLNWVPDSSTPNARPFKWLWIQEYGLSRAAWQSYPGTLTASCYADCEIADVSTNGGDTPPHPLGTKWCQIETIGELPWKKMGSSSGSIQRKVHFKSGTNSVPTDDFGNAFSTAKLNVVELSSVAKPVATSPYNTTSHTLNIPVTFTPIMGGTNGGGDPVDLATGLHVYLPAPDITVYNPYGPSVMFQRNCNSGLAREGKYSPGLSCGWVHNYDITITSANSILKLKYPNGYEEVINPSTGSRPAGAPYTVTGIQSSEPGQWASITLTFSDQTKWEFGLAPGKTDIYLMNVN